jgi:hypothetical protein
MPNFLVIGAAKCGTDALCSYLTQHPQVYMSANKEPNFFVAEGRDEIPYRGPGDREVLKRFDGWVSSLDRYQALFNDVTTERAIGEGSTWYIYDEGAHRRIHRHVPDMRLIAVLRNPADRAYSAFTMMMRDGRETTSQFPRALEAEDERVRSEWELLWHYKQMGFYHAQLERYYDTFDASQIRVVLYDDFSSRPADVVRDLFTFLEVDDRFQVDTSGRFNTSMVPKHPTYHRLIAGENLVKSMLKPLLPSALRGRVRSSLVQSNLTRPEGLAPEVRRELADVFRPDVLRLQGLLGRDLSHWLQ